MMVTRMRDSKARFFRNARSVGDLGLIGIVTRASRFVGALVTFADTDMNSSPIPWKHVRNVLVLFAPVWVGTILLFGAMGILYAIVSSDVYSARQPLVVRDEATTSLDRLGRFASQSDLKAAQETILEMTQNPEVVAAALRQIGPPSAEPDANWPSTETIDDVATNAVNLVAPKGSEFGNTEVVYLQVKSTSAARATALCRAMFDNLTEQLRQVRRVRARLGDRGTQSRTRLGRTQLGRYHRSDARN